MKAVFNEKIEAESKKKNKKGKDDEDEEMDEDGEESKQTTAAQMHKKFSQSLQPDEYQRLVQFFATEVPKLSLKLCQVKEFPNVDKLI